MSLIIEGQAYLAKDENLEKVINVLKSICRTFKNEDKVKEVDIALERILLITGSVQRWNAIVSLFKKNIQDTLLLAAFKKELTLGLLYPKLDAHVSAQANHLLKCPFNVHHDTGKISLPIEDIDNFDVHQCPTIFDVLEKDGLSKLQTAFNIFDRFCLPLVDKSVVAGVFAEFN